MRVATAQVTPPIAAAVIVTQIQTVVASSRAQRERRTRKKVPVGITALRASGESRVGKGPRLPEAGHRALAPDTSGVKSAPQITGKQRLRGAGAGVRIAAQRTRSSRREVKRERGWTAGTGRERAAPGPPRTQGGAARKAGRTEVKTGDTAEMMTGTEAAQMEGEAEQQMGGVEAGKGGRKGRAGEEVGVERGEREAKTEQKGSTDSFELVPSFNVG